MPEKIEEIEILRGIAALAVILIHTSASFMSSHTSNHIFFLLTTLNALSKFAVQVFIFITGVVLFYKYAGREYHIGQFYLKRMKYIAVPYLFWSALYLFLIDKFLKLSFPEKVTYYLQTIFNGQASYHTYFILLIAQFYLVFPVIEKMLGRLKFHRAILYWSAVVYFVLVFFDYYVVGLGVLHLSPVYNFLKSKLILYWFFYFVLGAYVGVNFHQWSEKFKEYQSEAMILMMLLLCGSIFEFFISVKKFNFDPGFAATPLKPGIFLYSLASIAVLTGLARMIVERNGLMYNFLRIVGKHSFGIYFAHPILLRIMAKINLLTSIAGNFFIVYFCTVFSTLVLTAIFSKYKKAAALIGAA